VDLEQAEMSLLVRSWNSCHVDYVSCVILVPHHLQGVSPGRAFMIAYAAISFLRSLARYGEQGLSLASGFEHLLVPSRLAFLQRSASGTACLRLS